LPIKHDDARGRTKPLRSAVGHRRSRRRPVVPAAGRATGAAGGPSAAV